MVACCGLECTRCEAFIATLNNDDAFRAKVAEDWARQYGAPISAEHINCTGCQSSGVKTYYCDQLCEVRKCATKRSFSTCAECADYACSLLTPILDAAPAARATLDALRKG